MAEHPGDIDRSVYRAVRDALRRGERPVLATVARELEISQSAVFRAAKRYGYRGWSDMVTQLGHYLKSQRSRSRAADPEAPDAGVELVAQALAAHRGGRVLVAAVGDAQICRQLLIYRLGELGFAAMPFTSAIAQASEHMLRERSRGSRVQGAQGGAPGIDFGGVGLALIVNESGMALLPECRECARRGFDVVAITANADSPVAKAASVGIVIKSNKSPLNAYEPNLFAAGALALMERAFARFLLLEETGADPVAASLDASAEG